MNSTRLAYWVLTTEGSYVEMDVRDVAEMLAAGFNLTIQILRAY
jgi:hypothetical protein